MRATLDRSNAAGRQPRDSRRRGCCGQYSLLEARESINGAGSARIRGAGTVEQVGQGGLVRYQFLVNSSNQKAWA